MRKYVLFLAVVSIIVLAVYPVLSWAFLIDKGPSNANALPGAGISSMDSFLPKSNKDVVLPVETWIKIGEERQIFNKNTEAGIVRRYYVDPSQHNGIGSTMSVFYKNGTEEMFWKGWNLYTDKGMYAIKFKDSFYVEPRPGPMTADMMTLRIMVTEFKNQGYIDSVDVNFFKLCLMDENHGVLKTNQGEEVCSKVDFTR